MELEDIVYELTCLQETMLLTCGDQTGQENPTMAHYGMALRRIVRDLTEIERNLREGRPQSVPVHSDAPGSSATDRA